MVADEAPQMFALVAEIGDRVDAIITVWCVKFPDHTEVISAGPDGVRGSFSTPEHARKLLSAATKPKSGWCRSPRRRSTSKPPSPAQSNPTNRSYIPDGNVTMSKSPSQSAIFTRDSKASNGPTLACTQIKWQCSQTPLVLRRRSRSFLGRAGVLFAGGIFSCGFRTRWRILGCFLCCGFLRGLGRGWFRGPWGGSGFAWGLFFWLRVVWRMLSFCRRG